MFGDDLYLLLKVIENYVEPFEITRARIAAKSVQAELPVVA